MVILKVFSLKSIEEMADWLNKVVSVIGIKDLTLLGHSQGCLVALEYFNKFPENIKKFNFCCWFLSNTCKQKFNRFG